MKIVYDEYVLKEGYEIYKYQSTDTSFIPNKFCSNLPRNKYYNSKRGIKISTINDKNGIPLSIFIDEGSVSDSKLITKTFNAMYAKPKTDKYKNSNRHKQYLLADKGYDSEEIRNMSTNKGYTAIIPFNKRNTKDKNKIKKLTNKEKVKLKKRVKVENYYAWTKMVPKLMFVIEKSINAYLQLLKLTTAILIFNRFLG